MIWKEETNNTMAPTNIQNSRLQILSSSFNFGIFLQLMINKTIPMAKKNNQVEDAVVNGLEELTAETAAPVASAPAEETPAEETPEVQQEVNPHTVGHATRAYRG